MKDYVNTYNFNGAFECGDGGGFFKYPSWMQKLHQSAWNHENLFAYRSSEDEQLNKTTFTRNKKYEHDGKLKFKIRVC
jgi:hypothetical protein